MNKARRASALVIGAMVAVAIGGGVALASSGGDDAATPSRAAITDALTDDASPSPSRSAGDPSPSRSAGDDGADTGLGSPSAAPSPPAGGSAVSVAQAKAIAISAAGGGRVSKVERETEHGRAVWGVEVISAGVEHDIDVDRQTGAVLRHKTDRDDRGGDDRDDDSSGHGRGRGGDDD